MRRSRSGLANLSVSAPSGVRDAGDIGHRADVGEGNDASGHI
jgi:hypothetical protein